jgi:2-hydroxy-3-keto-5-methylthiopentenyl-1-phosphate phosphatase
MSFSVNNSRLLFQSDFDGTITVGDVSFLLLDKYANGDWRSLRDEYKNKRITVGQFNTAAFKLVAQDRPTLERFVLDNYSLRPGFFDLLNCCHDKGIRFVIVSNGLDFYIKAIMKHLALDGVEIYAAQTTFAPSSIDTVYRDPAGNSVDDGFKEAYTRHFINQGYRIIYAGNGVSDLPAARLADRIFAIESLAEALEKEVYPFNPLPG